MTSPPRARRHVALVLLTAVLALPSSARAQEASPGVTPAFSLSSYQIFASWDQPHLMLTFQQVSHLDFRVYRVEDAERFFEQLKDPHSMGSPEPMVAQEPTLIERISSWKARQRERWVSFLRGQVSPAYRRARASARDKARLSQRRTVQNYTQFAQVPLLNPKQLVNAWRELLPRTRDLEARRLPLELPAPGLYLVEAVHERLRAYTIVAVSDVGLLTKTAPGQLFTWAVHRRSGEPQADCSVTPFVDRARQAALTSSAEGVAQARLESADASALVTVARCGASLAIADPGGNFLREPLTSLEGYVYSDRPIYRPGHTVNVKGVLRWRERGLLRAFDREQVEIALVDPNDKVLFRASRPVDRFGAVWATMTLPGGAALGSYTVKITSDDAEATGSFEVQEYRKPEFEVSVAAGERFVLQGGQARVSFSARYFFGQPVAHARVRYVVHRASYFSPYRWVDQPESEISDAPAFYGGDEVFQGETTLDEAGTGSVMIDVPEREDGQDATLRVEARVIDGSGREVSGHTTFVGQWARLLVAVGADRYLYRPGAQGTATTRVVDYRGAPQPGVTVQLALERLTYPDGRYDRPQADRISGTSVTTDDAGRAAWAFTTPAEPGDYRVRAEVQVDGRAVHGDASIFVPEGESTFYDEGDRTLELIADRATYQPGDTATLVLRGEAVTTPVLVTKEQDETTWHQVVRPTATGTLEVPIDESDIGDVWVNVSFVRDDRLYRAERRLRVPATARALTVAIEPAAPVARPRDPALFTVRVTDAAGAPVAAQLSVGVVDEAIYAIRPDLTPDPARFFHQRGYSRVGTQFSREFGFTGYSGQEPLMLAQRRRPVSLADFKAERPERAEVRREFPDAIYWLADLQTDRRGTATLRVAYPDALTTWRVTARAITEDTKAGASLARTTVTKDVILRLPTPRFLTEGDTLNLPVVVHNYHEDARDLTVTVNASGLTAAEQASSPRTFSVPPAGERSGTWTFSATRAGRATVNGSAETPGDGDRVEMSLPVLPYGLRREIGASGSSNASGTTPVPLEVPRQTNPAERTIAVSLAPTMAGSLLGALDFLTGYPYGCTEQVLSSFLPNLLVLRALDRLKLAPPERLGALDRMTAQGLRRLAEYQHEDGGWGWWPADQNHPFMTAYALYGLIEADRAGVPVERGRLFQGATATANLYAEYPRAVPELKAYMAWVLTLAAQRDIRPQVDGEAWNSAAVLEELWGARDRMSAYGQALLLLTLDATRDARANDLATTLLNAAQTRGDLAWWPSTRDPLLGEDVETAVEATALAVQALAPRQPTHPTLERAVRWLLANRTSGSYWGTTKQTALALYGLLALIEARGEQPTTFSVDVIVNGTQVGTHTFTPESWVAADPVVIKTPAREGANAVEIVKRGAGWLYWTASAQYYDVREPITRTGSRTLALTREYFRLSPTTTGGRIVYRQTPLTGTLAPGDVVLVRLTAAGAADWRYLVVDDPIPAGMEAVPEPDLYEFASPISWWTGSQREYRDARVVQFQESFEQGRYEYHYLLKAVTPGAFRAMPAQIARMYVPGVGASTATQAVTIVSPIPVTTPEAR